MLLAAPPHVSHVRLLMFCPGNQFGGLSGCYSGFPASLLVVFALVSRAALIRSWKAAACFWGATCCSVDCKFLLRIDHLRRNGFTFRLRDLSAPLLVNVL